MAQTYRAIQLQRFAPSFREATAIVDLPCAAPGPGEITARMTWCGVNGIFDTQIARDAVDYVSVGLPAIMGVEAVGHVTAVGSGVSEFALGDPVATVRFGGGYREEWTAQADRFAPIPAADPAHLALVSTGVSALVALDAVAELKSGETIAISAAGGGVGHFVVQLAKLRGCRVVAVCGGADKAARVAALGADRVIDYRAENVAEVLAREFTDALNVAMDTVSGPIFDAFLDNLAPKGRLVVAGVASDLEGAPETVEGPRIGMKLYYKGASIRGFMNALHVERWAAARATLFELYRQGKLQVWRDEAGLQGLEAVYDAVDRLLGGRNTGKVMVQLG
jgi:NADPH-dependent curcumin reductase CurA